MKNVIIGVSVLVLIIISVLIISRKTGKIENFTYDEKRVLVSDTTIYTEGLEVDNNFVANGTVVVNGQFTNGKTTIDGKTINLGTGASLADSGRLNLRASTSPGHPLAIDLWENANVYGMGMESEGLTFYSYNAFNFYKRNNGATEYKIGHISSSNITGQISGELLLTNTFKLFQHNNRPYYSALGDSGEHVFIHTNDSEEENIIVLDSKFGDIRAFGSLVMGRGANKSMIGGGFQLTSDATTSYIKPDLGLNGIININRSSDNQNIVRFDTNSGLSTFIDLETTGKIFCYRGARLRGQLGDFDQGGGYTMKLQSTGSGLWTVVYDDPSARAATNISSANSRSRNLYNPKKILDLEPMFYEKKNRMGTVEYGVFAEQLDEVGLGYLCNYGNNACSRNNKCMCGDVNCVQNANMEKLAIPLISVVREQEIKIQQQQKELDAIKRHLGMM